MSTLGQCGTVEASFEYGLEGTRCGREWQDLATTRTRSCILPEHISRHQLSGSNPKDGSFCSDSTAEGRH